MPDLFELPPAQPLIIVLTGTSGAGKDAVLNELKRQPLPELNIHFVVTTTSRPQRDNETADVDYHFVDTPTFEAKIAAGDFIEYALVYDQYKGITKTEIKTALQSGQDVLLRLDVQGAQTVKKFYPQAVVIFLLPDNEQVLRHRLTERRTDSAEQIEKRIQTVQSEMLIARQFDYLVVNRQGQLAQTVQTIQEIAKVEKKRPLRLFGNP